MTATACSLAAAFLLTLLGTPLIRKIALHVRAVDRPDGRKVHQREMPRLGGLAICLAFWAVVLATREMSTEMYGILGGGFLICLVGVWDDLRGVSPRTKLLFQVAAAVLAIAMGVRVDFMTHPLGGVIILQYLSYPVTILWIVGITNAVNLIDGLDGLAAGVSAIAAVTLGTVSVLEGFVEAGVLAFILAASVLGFLWHNFYPARIFMGDTGSLFLGFNLATLAILGLTKSATVISLFLPVIILGIPIIDTLLAIVRRYSNGKPIFSPDKEHLHHRLMALGYTQRRAVVTIYGISIMLGVSAVLMAMLSTAQGMFLLVLTTVGVFMGVDRLGILNKTSLEKSEKDGKPARHLAK